MGILSMVVPLYNAEISPKKLRGRLVALNQLAITAGIMVSDADMLHPLYSSIEPHSTSGMLYCPELPILLH